MAKKPTTQPKLMHAIGSQALVFPKDFAWGVATSAAQIEGAWDADGKTPSIWDFEAVTKGGRIERGETPFVACDHYHRFKDDIKLMKSLGVKHYRFSVSWPRVMPHGGDVMNPKGLDFYKRLCDALHAAGITPWATMFHWDLPQELEEKGGWPWRGVVEAFAKYSDALVKGLAGHVSNWMTINELHTFIQCGYRLGVHAPFRKETEANIWAAHHNVLLAHGAGVRSVRAFGGRGARVGFVHNPEASVPLDESPENVKAAKDYYEHVTGNYLYPLYKGYYADWWLKKVGKDRPKLHKGDMELISQPCEFLGLNQYGGWVIRKAPKARTTSAAKGGWEHLLYTPDFPRGGFDWLGNTPDVLYWCTRFTQELYGVGEMYITENGLHTPDGPDATGEIKDLSRCQWLMTYLRSLHRAVQEGVPVKGYFHWSFMDNFEWAHGYDKRLGLVHVDFATLKRTPKLSASVYRTIVTGAGKGAGKGV